MPLKAGKARRDITPSRPLFLVGYPHVPRTSMGVHDPLLATALSLDDGATAIILIAVDILFVERATADECRAAIRRSTGVPEGNILISATHTHSGPVTAPMLAWKNDPLIPPPDPGYMELFRRGIIQAGIEAHASAVPAEMAATTARIEGVGGNRHSPHGAFDPEAGLLYVREKGDGRPLALNLTYAMHPTVLHEDSKLVSSDFPHYARLVVEQQLPGVSVLYHNGPCGNLSLRFHVSGQTFAEAERVGRRLGALVLEALRALPSAGFRDDLVIRAAQESVDLPGQVDMMFAGNDQTANAVSVGPEAGELIVTLGTALVVYRHAGSQPGPYHNACPALRGAVCWGPYPGAGASTNWRRGMKGAQRWTGRGNNWRRSAIFPGSWRPRNRRRPGRMCSSIRSAKERRPPGAGKAICLRRRAPWWKASASVCDS